ncbi:hypothetical protein LPJ61_005899 [Coemansia biformis]|uniref:Uncharacterized protein n=1 Tax=Coemansia biformis TaxID=1286918 RepID=A0A9W8CTD2_9FUNG|nr:hypothetical protein LPJ61_005899 [Coemansia biformis]
MDRSRPPHRGSAEGGRGPAWGLGGGFTTPEGPEQHQHQQLVGSTGEHRLGAGLHPSGTPASRIAAAAVGRRLDLGPPPPLPPPFPLALHTPAAAPLPRFSLGGRSPPISSSPEHSAFTTPFMHQHSGHGELGWGSAGGRGSAAGRGDWISPVGQADQHMADGPPTPFGTQEVDEDFVLNLNQEGDLERLTRKAVDEARTAWKPLVMDSLKKQLASLDEDEWMYS